MEPTKFKHQNIVFGEKQPEYRPLPALILKEAQGVPVISCWKLSFIERLYVLFTGKIWQSMLSFGRPLTPSIVAAYRIEVYVHPDDAKNKWLRLYSWLNRMILKCNRKKGTEINRGCKSE